VKRFFISDDPCASTPRIAAIDIAHRQSRHFVLIDRASLCAARHNRS
jgi:hypothetical protein